MAKPATAVDPQVDFTPESLSTSFQKYRTELIVMPMFAMNEALKHMSVRTGIRYQEHVHEMKGNFEIGPYDKYKMGNGNIDIAQRTLQTYFGNCIEPIDVNSIYQSLWGSDINKGQDAMKNVPWTKRVCAYIMKQLGEKLFESMWTAVRNDQGTLTSELFNGFLAIENIEIAAGTMSQQIGNFYELPESITAANAEDILNDFYWGDAAAGWAGVNKKLRNQKTKIFMSDRTKYLYEKAYQMNHGSLPYNEQFQKAHLDGAPKAEFVGLSNVPDNYLSLTPPTNILSLWNQKTADEKFIVEKSLTSHYDNDFIANLFYGENYLSINPEMLCVAKITQTQSSGSSEETEDAGTSEGTESTGTEGTESTGTEGTESTGSEGTGSDNTEQGGGE